MTEKLENLFSEDRNEFWKYLKSMTNKKQNEENLPKIDKLVKHFKTLYFDEHIENDMNNDREVNDNLKKKYENLNTEFTENEVSKCVNNLKSKKSPGDDLITNEMIKCTNGGGIKLLTKLFNTILNLGYFPIEWNYGLLRLIHKDGDRDDEDNYRAITLNSCLGKLFCTILQNRLNLLLEKEKILCKEQAGFRKNHRATDHIFLLRKIVKTYTSQNKYLFTCFVDFSKAFDSIWRQALIQKVSNIGIHGKFLNIIKSIYTTTTNSIIVNDKLSETFPSNKGVKQGDTLSSTLFNLFLNDLPDIFKFEGNNPIYVGNTELSCLMYADDLIIISTCPISLQKCITKLEQYCDTWKLKINIRKTKIMIFNKQGSFINKYKFYYQKRLIENTKQYKYLGFVFTLSGKDNLGISNLLNQAKKAWFAIQKPLATSLNKNISTYLHLFDTQVKPIMLYACEAWTDSLKHHNNITDLLCKNNVENFHIRILKHLLGVHKKTSNISMLVETGRHPITLYAQEQSIKYFLRFPSTEEHSLLHDYYEKEENSTENGQFIEYIKDHLDKIGMSNIWKEQLLEKKNHYKNHNIIKDIKLRKRDVSSQDIISTLSLQPGKLALLNEIKNTHKFETYLNIHNRENRRAITKIRTSSHKLEIETGRWNNVNRDLRICKNCNLHEVENETHFLFECRMHVTERKLFYDTIKTKMNIDLSTSLPDVDKLKTLFSSEDLSVLNALGKYIKISLNKRENTTCYVLTPHYVYYCTI